MNPTWEEIKQWYEVKDVKVVMTKKEFTQRRKKVLKSFEELSAYYKHGNK